MEEYNANINEMIETSQLQMDRIKALPVLYQIKKEHLMLQLENCYRKRNLQASLLVQRKMVNVCVDQMQTSGIFNHLFLYV